MDETYIKDKRGQRCYLYIKRLINPVIQYLAYSENGIEGLVSNELYIN